MPLTDRQHKQLRRNSSGATSPTKRYVRTLPQAAPGSRILPMPSKPILVVALAIGAWSVLATAQQLRRPDAGNRNKGRTPSSPH